MTKKSDQRFEHSVKPYYHPSSKCSIVYSPEGEFLKDAKFKRLSVEDVKKEFGFNFICEDLPKSFNEAFEYIGNNNLLYSVPQSLQFFGEPYEASTYANEIFILHNSPSKMGLEVVSRAHMGKGLVVAEYIGERLSSNDIALDTTYLALNDDDSRIDAKNYGNIARFFNHCPSKHDNPDVLTANLGGISWQVSETLNKVFFVTTREIKLFEPLCWDYGRKYQFDQPMELLDANTYLPINGLLRDEADIL